MVLGAGIACAIAEAGVGVTDPATAKAVEYLAEHRNTHDLVFCLAQTLRMD